MRRTKEDAQQTRESLLDAAERLFAARGVSRTSLQDIARETGVTRGAVYWHFKDKTELFNAMMARTTLPMEGTLKSIDTANEPDPLGQLKASMLDAMKRIAHDPRTQRVFDIATLKVEYVDEVSGIRARHLDVHLSCRDHIEATFKRAQALGQIDAGRDARMLAVSYLAMVNGLIHNWMLDQSLFELVATAEASIDIFLGGLRSAPRA
jgi:TetR/AcrR family acrAB operon transcriptional repressor